MLPIRSRLLLVTSSGSYRIVAYLRAAAAMNVELQIASPGEHSLISEVQNGIHINPSDFNAALKSILGVHRNKPFHGVIGSDESSIELAAFIAQHLDLPHNPPSAAKLTQRKDLARRCLAEHNCAVPQFQVLDLSKPLKEQILNFEWPAVIKPIDMSASRGVIRVNSIDECLVRCDQVKKIVSFSNERYARSHLLLEQYIEGIEVAFEGYLHAGQLHPITLFDKPNPLTGPYFEETIYVAPSSLGILLQRTIQQCVQDACTAYKLTTGPIHAELRIDADNKPWILEVANRSIGGDCARTLDDADQYFLEKLIINLALGKPTRIPSKLGATGVMMLPITKAGILREITGVDLAKNVINITDVKINIAPGNELIPLPEGNQYLGYLFAKAETRDLVINALNRAYLKLAFHVSPIINILTPE